MLDMDTYIVMGIISLGLGCLIVLWSLAVSCKESVKARKEALISTAVSALDYANTVVTMNEIAGKYEGDDAPWQRMADHQQARQSYWIKYG